MSNHEKDVGGWIDIGKMLKWWNGPLRSGWHLDIKIDAHYLDWLYYGLVISLTQFLRAISKFLNQMTAVISRNVNNIANNIRSIIRNCFRFWEKLLFIETFHSLHSFFANQKSQNDAMAVLSLFLLIIERKHRFQTKTKKNP